MTFRTMLQLIYLSYVAKNWINFMNKVSCYRDDIYRLGKGTAAKLHLSYYLYGIGLKCSDIENSI